MKWVTASYLWMRCYFSAEITPSYVENGVRPLQCSTQCIFSQQVKYFFFLLSDYLGLNVAAQTSLGLYSCMTVVLSCLLPRERKLLSNLEEKRFWQ